MNKSTVIKSLALLFTLFGMPAFVHSADRGPSLLSHELCSYLTRKGIAVSCTTPYNPAGNGQVEKYNGTVWRAVTMACRSKNLPIKYWQDVLPDALYSLRSLLCTATKGTPHERLLCFSRCSTSGCSIPSWLTIPGPVYMYLKCHVRTSKTEPLVDEVELIRVNSHYAHVRYPDGRETTLSSRHLESYGEPTDCLPPSVPIQPGPSLEGEPDPHPVSTPDSPEMEGIPAPPSTLDPDVPLRQSEHTRNPVDWLVLHF